MDPLNGVMTFDEFWPEIRGLQTFRSMLADFGLDQREYDQIIEGWVVYFTSLPENMDGVTVPNEVQLNDSLEPFNRKLTFIHELSHVLQYSTGHNVVKFEAESGELKDLAELKKYIEDSGEKQAACNQLRYLATDNCMDKEQAWAYMKWGWGMDDAPVSYEVENVVRHHFEALWNEVAPKAAEAGLWR